MSAGMVRLLVGDDAAREFPAETMVWVGIERQGEFVIPLVEVVDSRLNVTHVPVFETLDDLEGYVIELAGRVPPAGFAQAHPYMRTPERLLPGRCPIGILWQSILNIAEGVPPSGFLFTGADGRQVALADLPEDYGRRMASG